MKILHFSAVSVVGVSLLAVSAAAQMAIPQPTPILPIPMPSIHLKVLRISTMWQETPQWCWAASGQMVMNYIGAQYIPPNVPQCYEANQEFGRTDCCTCPTPATCVSPGWPQFDKWGFTSDTTAWGTALLWNDLVAQIDSEKPFMFSWEWNGGGGHAMVVKGYSTIGANKWVIVANPWGPQGRCGPGGDASGPFGGHIDIDTYAAFVSGTTYTHGADVYNVAHK